MTIGRAPDAMIAAQRRSRLDKRDVNPDGARMQL